MSAGVAKLLLDSTANINTHSNEFKESALTLACYKGHLEMVKYLLNAGTMVNVHVYVLLCLSVVLCCLALSKSCTYMYVYVYFIMCAYSGRQHNTIEAQSNTTNSPK